MNGVVGFEAADVVWVSWLLSCFSTFFLLSMFKGLRLVFLVPVLDPSIEVSSWDAISWLKSDWRSGRLVELPTRGGSPGACELDS